MHVEQSARKQLEYVCHWRGNDAYLLEKPAIHSGQLPT